MRNVYFSDKVRSEQNLYDDIVIESLKIYGQDLYYIPRDIVNKDPIFGEDVPSRFNSSYKIEMYIDNIEGFDGEGDLFTRFGVEIRDEATFVVSRRRWQQTVSQYDNEIEGERPREGDLIYLPMTNKMFEISHVEHEQPFYQLANLPVYKLRANLFEYNDEDFDTGVDAIDTIEREYAYKYILQLTDSDRLATDNYIGEMAVQTLPDGTIIRGEVVKYSDSDDKLHLIHVGANDGDYHTFITTAPIEIGDSDLTVLSVTEENQISNTEQNDDFQSDAAGFLDFSESNPFGDPS